MYSLSLSIPFIAGLCWANAAPKKSQVATKEANSRLLGARNPDVLADESYCWTSSNGVLNFRPFVFVFWSARQRVPVLMGRVVHKKCIRMNMAQFGRETIAPHGNGHNSPNKTAAGLSDRRVVRGAFGARLCTQTNKNATSFRPWILFNPVFDQERPATKQGSGEPDAEQDTKCPHPLPLSGHRPKVGRGEGRLPPSPQSPIPFRPASHSSPNTERFRKRW